MVDHQIPREVALALCGQMIVEPLSQMISQNFQIVAKPKLPLTSLKNEGKSAFVIRVFGVDRAHVHLPFPGGLRAGKRSDVT